MLQEMEQSFAALSSRDKMKFLRWAAESVGAKLDTVFGPTLAERAERLRIIAHEPNEILAEMKFVEFSKTAFEDEAQLDIPGFLKR